MDLYPDVLQEQLADAVRAALSRPGDPWQEVAAVGVPAVSLPPEFGGLGLGVSADIMVNRELGRALNQLYGYRETVFGVELLKEEASNPLRNSALANYEISELRVAPVGLLNPVIVENDAQGRAWGTTEPLDPVAWHAIILRSHDRWVLFELDDRNHETEHTSLMRNPAIRLRLRGVEGRSIAVSCTGFRRAVAAARIRQAAFLLGVAERSREAAREHVSHRQQFGQSVIEFQTVRHRLATCVAEMEGWTLLLHEAAWRHDRGEESDTSAAQILAAAADHALSTARLAVQLCGARGMLQQSIPATAYRIASVEAVRFGPPRNLWLEAGRARLRQQTEVSHCTAAGTEPIPAVDTPAQERP